MSARLVAATILTCLLAMPAVAQQPPSQQSRQALIAFYVEQAVRLEVAMEALPPGDRERVELAAQARAARGNADRLARQNVVGAPPMQASLAPAPQPPMAMPAPQPAVAMPAPQAPMAMPAPPPPAPAPVAAAPAPQAPAMTASRPPVENPPVRLVHDAPPVERADRAALQPPAQNPPIRLMHDAPPIEREDRAALQPPAPPAPLAGHDMVPVPRSQRAAQVPPQIVALPPAQMPAALPPPATDPRQIAAEGYLQEAARLEAQLRTMPGAGRHEHEIVEFAIVVARANAWRVSHGHLPMSPQEYAPATPGAAPPHVEAMPVPPASATAAPPAAMQASSPAYATRLPPGSVIVKAGAP